MPEPVLGPGDTAVNKVDKNPYLQGSYWAVVGFALPCTLYMCLLWWLSVSFLCLSLSLSPNPLPHPTAVLRNTGCAYSPLGPPTVFSASHEVFIEWLDDISHLKCSFPQPAFFKVSLVSSGRGPTMGHSPVGQLQHTPVSHVFFLI